MSVEERPMRWWGWAESDHPIELSAEGAALLRDELGLDGTGDAGPVALEDVRVPEPDLPAGAEEELRAAVGEENVLTGGRGPIPRAAGRSYPDLFRLRSGDATAAPDAVVLPGAEAEVTAVLAA